MTTYATADAFALFGLPSAAIPPRVTPSMIAAQLEAASREIDASYATRGYGVPLATWGADTTQRACILAAESVLFTLIGANPADPANTVWLTRADAARLWLHKVATGEVTPTNIAPKSSDKEPSEGGPVVTSEPLRGW